MPKEKKSGQRSDIKFEILSFLNLTINWYNMVNHLFTSETCGTTIIPLVCKICQQAVQAEDATLPVVATQLGKLCHGISGKN